MRPPSNAIPSLISSDVIIKGNVSTVGEIQIDGTIDGDVKSKNLTVGENGTVNGKVTADDVVVKGTIKGSISGRNVRLEKSAKMTGDISHETLSIEAGAYIEGNLTHQSAQPAAANAQKVMSASSEPKKEEPKEDKKDLVDLI